MPADLNRLCWLDMEMSGLMPDSDRVLELALLVTDSDLNHLSEGRVIVVHQPNQVLDAMDGWNKSVHGKSGLIERVRASELDEAGAETLAIEFLTQYVSAGNSPLCGNSICQDRRFLARWMPRLEAFFHYRNLDVSTIKELARRWRPDLMDAMKKESSHKALDDIRESIKELQHYREHFFKTKKPESNS